MKINSSYNGEQGFTLVEAIIGMMLMIILMTATLSLFNVSIRSHQFSMGRVNDLQQSRQAVDIIVEEIRYAKSIVPPTSPFRTLQYTDANDIINVLSFNPSDKRVYLKHGESASKAITSGIFTDLQFNADSKGDTKLLIIKMTLKDDRTQETLETETMVHLLN